MTEEPVSAGLLVDSSLRRWQIDALTQMVKAGASIDVVIVNRDKDSRFLYNLRNARPYLIIAGARELSVRLFRNHPFLQPINISDIELLDGVERIGCEPNPRSDLGKELPESIVRSHCENVDFLVRFGFGIIKGDVLRAPRYGVFSYHHGDIRKYRGRPAGFWEFMHDEDTVCVTLQQLTDELDSGRIIQLKEFDISACDTYQDILETMYMGSIDMLPNAVSSIRDSEFSPTVVDSTGDIYTAPGWISTARYIIKNLERRF